MAYGRDAQAEEILLDALKNEPTRHAIQVKLLEIYAQRKSLKQFETQASELYAQTGGVGGEWEKAAAMGRKLDPANPIYGGKTGAEAPESEAGAATTVGAAAVAAGAVAFAATSASAEPQDAEADKLHDTWAMPSAMNRIEPNQVDAEGGATTIVLPADKAAQAAAPQGVADDLVLDLPELDTAPAPKAPETEAFEPSGLDFDLGLDFAPADTAAPPLTDEESATSVPPEPAIVEKAAVPTEEAVDATHAAAAASDHEETDVFAGTESLVTRSIIDFDMGDAVEPETASPREEAKADVPVMDLERTDVAGTLIDFNLDELTASRPAGDVGVMDLERTDVGGNLLDFNFELEQGTAKQQASGEPTATLDLSGINLDLPGSASSDAAAAIGETTAAAAGQEEAGADGENAEAATKIDLAKAYEEMGDQEGARELLEEVLHEGSAGQQEKARTMLASLGR
jgi:pilus assembly protein FimV